MLRFFETIGKEANRKIGDKMNKILRHTVTWIHGTRFFVVFYHLTDAVKDMPIYVLLIKFHIQFSGKCQKIQFVHRINWWIQPIYMYRMWNGMNDWPMYVCLRFHLYSTTTTTKKNNNFTPLYQYIRSDRQKIWLRLYTWCYCMYISNMFVVSHDDCFKREILSL